LLQLLLLMAKALLVDWMGRARRMATAMKFLRKLVSENVQRTRQHCGGTDKFKRQESPEQFHIVATHLGSDRTLHQKSAKEQDAAEKVATMP
jgi:hypothetical protein